MLLTAFCKVRPIGQPEHGPTKSAHLKRITHILVLLVSLQISASGYGQTITISRKNVPIETIFTDIKNQSNYLFWYEKSLIEKLDPIDLEVKNGTIQQVLDRCFKNLSLTYSIVDSLIVIRKALKKTSGSTPVKGRVVNEQGIPVFANVSVKGAQNMVSTDEEGRFVFEDVADEAVLIISGVNIEPYEIKRAGKADLQDITVKMKVTQSAEVKVMNTGFQDVPRERATGSFTQIDNKLYNEQVGTGVLSRLEYVANGLTVLRRRIGSVQQMMVRGLSSISGPRDPLIILDNFPYEGDINNINPNDIENITILKDAAAASIWGTKAGNGVIVITTKKGKFNQKATIEFNSNLTIGESPDLFSQHKIAPSDAVDVELFLFNKKYRFADTAKAAKPSFSPIYEILFNRRKGLISAQDSASQIDAFRSNDFRNELNRYMYQNAVNQQYAVNVRGGNNTVSYIMSVGYDKNSNELAAGYNRLNFRLQNSFRPLKNLEITTGIYFTQSKATSGRQANFANLTGGPYPYTTLADEAGNPNPIYRNRQPYIDTTGAGKLLDWRFYPLEDYKHTRNSVKQQDIIATVGISYRLLSSLSIDIKYQYEKQRTDDQTLNDLQSYFTRNLINTYTQINRSTGAIINKVPIGGILDMNSANLVTHNVRGQLNFNKSIGAHSLAAIAGYEVRQTNKYSNAYRVWGYDPDLLTNIYVDNTTSYPTYIAGNKTLIPNYGNIENTLYRFVSLFSNAAYTYQNKYTISGSLRRDASNLFGLHTNDKWNPLWSTGFSWEVSKESFYKSSLLPYLRLRTTFGFSGNVDPTKSAATTLSFGSPNPYTNTQTASIRNYYNPDLRWEKVRMLNIGMDIGSIGNILTGSIEWYYKHSTDLYGTVPADLTLGIGYQVVRNVAILNGNGLDVDLTSLNINKAIKWTTQWNFSYYTDKVIKYYNPSGQAASYAGYGATLEGKPLYAMYGLKWMGLDPANGDPQGYINGHVSKDYNAILGDSTQLSDLVYKGSGVPKFYGSIGNSISWRNLSVTARFTYKLGYYFLRESIVYSSLYANGNGHGDLSDRWQKPGDENFTNVPSMDYPANASRNSVYAQSEALISKGDNIRLQYVNISYDFKKTPNRHLPFEHLQLYLLVNNVGMVWKANKEGFDPDFSGLPPSRNYSFGIRAQF